MPKLLRLPLALVAAVLVIAAVVALRPVARSTVAAPGVARASDTSSAPGMLVPYLRFAGTGSVTVKPDRATITVDAVGNAATSRTALSAASKKLAAVTAKLKALGVADDDVRTSSASTYQDWDTKAYHADVALTVTVRDPKQAGKLLAEANAAGADNVSGPSFSVEDSHAAYAAALKQAISDARAKADAAASQIGVHVTGVVSIDDASSGSQVRTYADAAAASSEGPAPVPIEMGTQEIRADATVVFSYAR